MFCRCKVGKNFFDVQIFFEKIFLIFAHQIINTNIINTMKRTLIIIMMLLASSLTMAQLSPGADGIRQKLAEYARTQNMKVNFEGDALTIQKDTNDYAVLFSGSNPVFVEIRLYDLDISDCIPECIKRAANDVNYSRSSVKAFITPNNQTLRFSVETFVNDAQTVINTFLKHLDILRDAWKGCRKRYDEFVDNLPYANRRMPFEVYSADIANVDQDDRLITDLDADIKSSDSQYINTSLSLVVYEDGDYPIGIKFITPDGKTSKAEQDGSPYTFINTLHITQQQSSYLTGGWGSANPGTWPAGQYRIEFYYKDKLFYIKNFEIK